MTRLRCARCGSAVLSVAVPFTVTTCFMIVRGRDGDLDIEVIDRDMFHRREPQRVYCADCGSIVGLRRDYERAGIDIPI